MVLIQVPESFDLVLEFNSELSRENFLQWIDTFFTNSNPKKSNSEGNDENNNAEKNESSSMAISSSDDTISMQGQIPPKRKVKLLSAYTRSEILKEAETKERRQEKLDHFFREAGYVASCGLNVKKITGLPKMIG